jgi:hypothetical protein
MDTVTKGCKKKAVTKFMRCTAEYSLLDCTRSEDTAAQYKQNWLNHVSKVKVKLSLCLTKHHSMKAYGGVEV